MSFKFVVNMFHTYNDFEFVNVLQTYNQYVSI